MRIWEVVSATPRRGRRPVLGLYKSVVLTLVILRSNLSQMTVADLFGISQPTVSRVYRRFLPLLQQVTCLHVPSIPEVVRGRLVLLDGTLVPTGNRTGHDDNYSGKRRRAGLSVQILADTTGCLLAVSTPVAGKTHDRAAFAEVGWEENLAGQAVLGDLGYLGTSVITPRKKPKGGELSISDKDNNRKLSAIRSAVERAIAHLKNWKIIATGYRGRLAELPSIIRIVTTLEFYRLDW
jgi:DDE superfamily endonuclease